MPSTWTSTAHLRSGAERFPTLLAAFYLLVGIAKLVSSSPTLLPTQVGPRVMVEEENCPSQVLQYFNTNPRRRHVELMIPEAADRCAHYHYDTVLMPNLVGHSSQQEALAAFDSYHLLQMTNCSFELGFFLCLMHFPMYSETGNHRIPIAPSRSLCNRVRNECVGIMNFRDYDWPEQLACDLMPDGPEFCRDGAFYPCLNREQDLIQAPAVGNESTRDRVTTRATAATTTPQSGGARGDAAAAPMPSSATWKRAPASSVPDMVRSDSRNAYPSVGQRCMLTKSDQAPPPGRDVIAALGYPQSQRCCTACSAGVRHNVRAIVAGRRDASLWSWAFMGSMQEANVTVRDGLRYFVLRASIHYTLQEGEGTNITSQGGEVVMLLAALNADDCMCARPDKVVTNVFMGTVAPARSEDGAPVYLLRRMDAIWPSPSNGYPLPRMYNKWKKLLRTNRKKARNALRASTPARATKRTARQPTPTVAPSLRPSVRGNTTEVDVPRASSLESLSSRHDVAHVHPSSSRDPDKEEAALGVLGASPATEQQQPLPVPMPGKEEAEEDTTG